MLKKLLGFSLASIFAISLIGCGNTESVDVIPEGMTQEDYVAELLNTGFNFGDNFTYELDCNLTLDLSSPYVASVPNSTSTLVNTIEVTEVVQCAPTCRNESVQKVNKMTGKNDVTIDEKWYDKNANVLYSYINNEWFKLDDTTVDSQLWDEKTNLKDFLISPTIAEITDTDFIIKGYLPSSLFNVEHFLSEIPTNTKDVHYLESYIYINKESKKVTDIWFNFTPYLASCLKTSDLTYGIISCKMQIMNIRSLDKLAVPNNVITSATEMPIEEPDIKGINASYDDNLVIVTKSSVDGTEDVVTEYDFSDQDPTKTIAELIFEGDEDKLTSGATVEDYIDTFNLIRPEETKSVEKATEIYNLMATFCNTKTPTQIQNDISYWNFLPLNERCAYILIAQQNVSSFNAFTFTQQIRSDLSATVEAMNELDYIFN